jgi:hypothetical protein
MLESKGKKASSNQSIDRKKLRVTRIVFGLTFGALLSTLGATVAQAEGEDPQETEIDAASERRYLYIRPHAGVGWASAYNRSGNALALHAGGRLLFPAPLSSKVAATFGLEATYLQLDITGRDIFSERYAVVGVVLEMTVVKGFNLGIGTLGYIGIGANDRNPFGVVTNLGWEPMWDSRVRPHITLRTEWIFDQATYNVMSLSAGITFGI